MSPRSIPRPHLSRTPLLGIFGIAIVLRGILVATTRGDPIFDVPMLDAEYAVDWARRIQAGDLWGSPEGTAYFRTPLYPAFLAAVFFLPGPDLLAARLVQAVLGAVTAVLLASVAAARFGRVAGVAAGLLAACSWPLLVFGRELLIAPLSLFLGALILRVWDGTSPSARLGRWLGIGALMGLAAVARPNSLAFLPIALILAAYGPGRRGDARRPLVLLAGVVLMIAPVTLRNRVVSGEWIPLSYQAGINLWIGNHPEADGMSAVLPGFSSWRNEDVAAYLAREYGRPVGPAEQDAHFRRLAWGAVRGAPIRAFALLLRKTGLFLQAYEIRNNRDLYALRERNRLLGLPWPDFGFVGPLALLGMGLVWKRRRELSHLFGYAIAMAAGVILFFVCARYRLAAWPPLLVFAGAGIAGLVAPGISRGRRLLRLGILVALLLLARIDFLDVRHPDPSQPHYQYGNVYARVGDYDAAEAEFRRALSLTPGFSEARHHLAATYLRRGRPDLALPELRLAVAGLPNSFRVRRALAEALEATGRIDEAVAARREAAELSAGDPGDLLALANALGMMRAYSEAWDLFVRLDSLGWSEDPYYEFNAGQTALALDREEEGLALLRRATRHEEVREGAWTIMARYHLSRRDPEPALPVLSEALLHAPENVDLRRLRAVARYALGDADGAVEDLEKVVELDPADSDSRRRLDEILESSGLGD